MFQEKFINELGQGTRQAYSQLIDDYEQKVLQPVFRLYQEIEEVQEIKIRGYHLEFKKLVK